jgi:hypothetical protein
MGGVSNGHAVITTGCRGHTRGRHVPQQQVRERAPGLERPGALQLLQLEGDTRQVTGRRIEVGQVELDHRRTPDIWPDDVVGAADFVTGDHDGRLAV